MGFGKVGQVKAMKLLPRTNPFGRANIFKTF